MADATMLGEHLATLDQDGLTGLLTRRPDVLAGAAPRDLEELAHRLWHRYSLVEAIRTVDMAQLQVLEAAASLGDGCTIAALIDLLAGDGPEHDHAIEQALQELTELAVVTVRDGDRLALPAALAELMPNPLGLGPPLAVLLPALNVDQLRRVLIRVGAPATVTRRAELEAALTAFYADPDNVATLLASAPGFVRAYLTDQLAQQRSDDGFALDDDDEVDDRAFDRIVRQSRFDPKTYRQQQEAETWAVERALLVANYGYGAYVPAEVARALSGDDFRAPFVPGVPQPVVRPADAALIERAATAAASTLFGQLLAVLDHVARHPVASLKAGGVGARELTKLAKTCRVEETTVRLVLECADRLGLLERHNSTVGAAAEFATWRGLDPGEQLAGVIRAWWAMGANPTETRDNDGKPLRALANPAHCAGCEGARTGLLEALAELPADVVVERPDIAPTVLWHHPFVHIAVVDADDPFATPWREAETLGVIAAGALSRLGRALVAPTSGVDDLLVAAARDALPAVAERATFGSDLTAYAVGAPSARVTAVLDSSADRESSGGAITWRFSPASVRRALDDGVTSDALLAGLTEIAGEELPQPLRYLLADVARRHGNLRLSAAASCVRSDDVALLAEVAADRKLARLGLRLLAPTVLAADVTLDALLTALRGAGYLPVVETGPPTTGAASAAKADADADQSREIIAEWARKNGFDDDRLRRPTKADPAEVAAALVGQRTTPRTAGARATSKTETTLRRFRLKLSPFEVRQLADAIDNRGRVAIAYRSNTGGVTQRVISDLELVGQSINAWCELRSAERYFAVSGILSVVAV